jgi:hypothetical protein
VDDFVMRINGLVASLCELGEETEDSHVVMKILKKLRQVGVAIEMLTDLDTMTMEQLVGRLLVAEVADAEDVGDCCSRRTTLVHAQAATEVLQAASNNCNKRGHIAKFYPERREKAMLADVDEECALL